MEYIVLTKMENNKMHSRHTTFLKDGRKATIHQLNFFLKGDSSRNRNKNLLFVCA